MPVQGRCLGPLDPCSSFDAVHMGCGAAVALPAAQVGCSGALVAQAGADCGPSWGPLGLEWLQGLLWEMGLR